MDLASLKRGEKALVVKVKGHGSFRKRIEEMGFVKGELVKVVKRAPFNGPSEYSVMGYHISLRASEAKLIEVVSPQMSKEFIDIAFDGIIEGNKLKITENKHGNQIDVAFVGNPNCGKTSLFNFVSGAKEHVGNYSGVTVGAKKNKYTQSGYNFNLVDLPGTYSLTAYTPEELYVRRHIFRNHPDIVVNVVDASNLERNLYLTTQLIDMDIKVVIALNMYDDLQNSGSKLDIDALGNLLGIPIIPTIATKGVGVKELFGELINVYENRNKTVRHIHINYGEDIEKSIENIQSDIKENKYLASRLSPRFLSVKLLEQDAQSVRMVSRHDKEKKILRTAYKESGRVEKILGESSETVITNSKYGFIRGALKETLKQGKSQRWKQTNRIDKVLTHKVFGGPIFLFFMFAMFFATFNLGAYPMGWIDAGVGWLNETLKSAIPQGMLNDLLTDGIVSGAGSVLVFLPNILILFLCISFMEDTGYMARAAFMMDKFMHLIGLHGRTFIPLVMGFGCNVPAIMATRTIRNASDRILTILLIPFMSCSARLPVFILFIAAFFPNNPTLVMISLYLTGILLAILSALVFNKTLFKSKEAPFVMELPPYRMPSFKSILIHMWDKSVHYFKKVGGVILVAVVIIWALGYFPQEVNYSQNYEQQISKLESLKAEQDSKSNSQEVQSKIDAIQNKMSSEQLENSYLGRIGKFIEPVIKPLGLEWRTGIALLSGLAAKEVVVGTLGVLLQASDTDDYGNEKMISKLRSLKYESGEKAGTIVFTPLVAAGLLIFVLIYFPCVGVIGAVAKESGRWRWAVFIAVYTTGLAWVLSFLVYQIGSLFL